MYVAPFSPGPTVTSAAITGTSQSVTLGAGGGLAPQLMFTLSGTTPATCFVKFGTGTVVATATDTPITPNYPVVLTPPPGTTSVGIIGSAGVLYITVGHGSV